MYPNSIKYMQELNTLCGLMRGVRGGWCEECLTINYGRGGYSIVLICGVHNKNGEWVINSVEDQGL